MSVVFQGVAQRTIFRTGSNNGNETWRIPMKATYLNTSNQSVGNTWTPENPNAHYPTYQIMKQSMPTTISLFLGGREWNVCSSEERDIGIYFPSGNTGQNEGYQLCPFICNRSRPLGVSKINDGWDPEASKNVSGTGRYPFVRTVTFGLNVAF